MSHENWLKSGLTLIIVLILGLVSALTWSIGWDLLQISSLIFVLLYPLIWLAWRCNQFWHDAIMQLTTYTQILKEGEYNLRYKKQHQNNLLLGLQQEISALAKNNQNKNMQDLTVETLLSRILDSWPVPVCLFDHNLKLTYRNAAMNEQLQQPMLSGTTSSDLGFKLDNSNFSHVLFDDNWQCQSISYLYNNEKHWLFSALDISKLLHQNQNTTQQNLIRVLGHELRNSLTPMASMADTLLNNDNLDEAQTRLVLDRIRKRSNRLLDFINQYSQLTHLPPAKSKWFDFTEIYTEAKSMITKDCQFDFQGSNQCFGDEGQVSQILINLFKNAQEACLETQCKINIKIFYNQNEQTIEIADNGPGFANLDNVLTPFYTTKSTGSGIGLSLCAGIARNHDGQLKVVNQQKNGAKVIISWPIKN